MRDASSRFEMVLARFRVGFANFLRIAQNLRQDLQSGVPHGAGFVHINARRLRILMRERRADGAHEMTVPQNLIVKLDFGILGESPYEHARYANVIRSVYGPKYGYLSDSFRNGRAGFLNTLQERLLWGTVLDSEHDEQMAINVKWELEELEQGR